MTGPARAAGRGRRQAILVRETDIIWVERPVAERRRKRPCR